LTKAPRLTFVPTPVAIPVDPLTGVEAARFGLYVHFPFCLSKCPYCDFASVVAPEVPHASYADKILLELQARAIGRAGRALQSIYIGGGTPSLWKPQHVARLLSEASRLFVVDAKAEITLEANPGAADAERFAELKAAGINRVSIGVQSFQPRTLAALGRAHTPDEARKAYAAARAAGFENVSLDFIYGVHGQTPAEVQADAREAASLGADHLSAYALTLDKDSLAEEVPLAKQLSRGEVALPEDEVVTGMQRTVAQEYGAAGHARYEVSNYARPGFHSRHNAIYWTGGEYLAIGAGATGFLREGKGGVRYSNPRSVEKWSGGVPAAQEQLSAAQLFSERVAMGLRLQGGIDVAEACREYGEDPSRRLLLVRQLVHQGLAVEEAGRVRLTERGFDVHSAIAARLM
jgi:putative oxygen-independent coproporphyrinogen III oxidase